MAYLKILMFLGIIAEGIMASRSCMHKLGISNSSIVKDNQMSSSSYLYSEKEGIYHFKPYFGRLHTRGGGGSWCSANSKKGQFIQIDFLRNLRISYVQTQGRYKGAEFVGSFKVRYQRSSDAAWRIIRDRNAQEKLFSANNDTNSVVGNRLPYTIIARKFRVYPTGDFFSIQCLRMEILGCQLQASNNNLLSYTAPFGMKLGKFDFTDATFDGSFNSNTSVASGGLGKLVDGFYGSNDLKGWLGFNISRIETIFQFSKSRRFSEVIFYTRSLTNSAILVNIETSESKDGLSYTLAKNVSGINIETAGSKISVKLDVAKAKWLKFVILQKPRNFLLIGEVVFRQGEPREPTTTSRPTEKPIFRTTKKNLKKDVFEKVDVKTSGKLEPVTIAPSDESGPPQSRGGSKRTESFYIILGVATFIAATFTMLIVMLVCFLKRDRSDGSAGKYSQAKKRGSDATKVSEPLLKAVNFQGVCGTSRYASPAMVTMNNLPADKEISRTAIQYENKIGGGEFGEVFIGQIICPKDGSLSMSRHSLIGQKVFIEMLKKGSSVEASAQLDEEIQSLSCLRHPNICRLIAVCSTSQPKFLLTECLEGMRLDSYLSSLKLSTNVQKSEILADIVVKISSALKYLASIKVVHRDIAARNVIYGVGSVVKLTNTAAACPGYYDCYYYLKDKRCLHPIRWMAPETLSDTQITVQSDVWSFGVLLWEIYTFAKLIPFEALGNVEVLSQLKLLNTMSPRSVEYLPLKFLNCPVLIWRIMSRCWTVGPSQRITADQIYETLTN